MSFQTTNALLRDFSERKILGCSHLLTFVVTVFTLFCSKAHTTQDSQIVLERFLNICQAPTCSLLSLSPPQWINVGSSIFYLFFLISAKCQEVVKEGWKHKDIHISYSWQPASWWWCPGAAMQREISRVQETGRLTGCGSHGMEVRRMVDLQNSKSATLAATHSIRCKMMNILEERDSIGF